jgi:hypothetical protein
MAVSGSQFTRIGAYLAGVGKKLVILAKAAALIVDEGIGLLSIINTSGKGLLSAITVSQGLSSTIDPSEGISSIISDSLGVLSTIVEHGVGVNSGT